MKYLEDYIKEAEEVKTRFEESKELILCGSSRNTIDKTIITTLLNKYDSEIASVTELINLLRDVKEYKTKKALLDFMTKGKA